MTKIVWTVIKDFVWNSLKKFFKWIFSSWKNILIVLLAVISAILLFSYRSVKSDYDNFVLVNSDTLTVYKNKLGELYSERIAYITDIENLKNVNTELYNEVQSLKDNPIVVTKIKTTTEYKDIVIRDTITRVNSEIYTSLIRYQDDWCNINGNSVFDTGKYVSTTTFDSISFNNNFTVNLLDKDEELSFIVKSDNPYCKINSIEGAVVSPENSKALKKRFEDHWVISAGIGGSLVPIDDNVKLRPSISVIFGYKLFGF